MAEKISKTYALKTDEPESTNGYHFFLKSKLLNLKSGSAWIVAINSKDAERLSIMPGDELKLEWAKNVAEVFVDITDDLVSENEIGLFSDVWENYEIQDGELLKLSFAQRATSMKAIYKKLRGGKLSFKEIYQIIVDIVNRKLSDMDVSFYIAPSFDESRLDLNEMYYTTKAIAMTGDTLDFGNLVADKHSTGGLPGNRMTPIIVPIVASYGVCIPKTSSRSITSPAGTADALEAIMKVDFKTEDIKRIVKENNACLVWGGSLKLAPADDIIIEITHNLGIEPYSKMVISVMAKKVAMGITDLVIDIPVAKGAKIPDIATAHRIEKMFQYLAKKFEIKTKVVISKSFGPIGRGIGPNLEMRDVMRVLQQKITRPIDLENKSIKLAGCLLEMTKVVAKGQGEKMARLSLKNGLAFQKMSNIIKSQNGNPAMDSEDLKVGPYFYEFKALNGGFVNSINSHDIVEICNLLGTPHLMGSGVYLNKQVGEKYSAGDTLMTLYSESEQRLNFAKQALRAVNIYK